MCNKQQFKLLPDTGGTDANHGRLHIRQARELCCADLNRVTGIPMMVSSWRAATRYLPEEQSLREVNENNEPSGNLPLRARTRKMTKQFEQIMAAHGKWGGVSLEEPPSACGSKGAVVT